MQMTPLSLFFASIIEGKSDERLQQPPRRCPGGKGEHFRSTRSQGRFRLEDLLRREARSDVVRFRL